MTAIEPSAKKIPTMGYGTWNRSPREAYQGVLAALEVGYRHIDTAQQYANEAEVAEAIADSSVPRSEIFLTTKVAAESYGPGQVMLACQQSLEKLRTDQVDLLLLHWPSPHNEYPLESYVAQFAEVFDAGMAKQIGVSNFTIPLINRAQELLGARPITMNQVECHVYLQNGPIVRHCRQIGVPITAYSPLARGAVVDDPSLVEIAEAHQATATQIALAFLLAEGFVVIPSSSRPERIASNFSAKDIILADDELRLVRRLDRGMRLVNGPWCPAWDV